MGDPHPEHISAGSQPAPCTCLWLHVPAAVTCGLDCIFTSSGGAFGTDRGSVESETPRIGLNVGLFTYNTPLSTPRVFQGVVKGEKDWRGSLHNLPPLPPPFLSVLHLGQEGAGPLLVPGASHALWLPWTRHFLCAPKTAPRRGRKASVLLSARPLPSQGSELGRMCLKEGEGEGEGREGDSRKGRKRVRRWGCLALPGQLERVRRAACGGGGVRRPRTWSVSSRP